MDQGRGWTGVDGGGPGGGPGGPPGVDGGLFCHVCPSREMHAAHFKPSRRFLDFNVLSDGVAFSHWGLSKW